MSLLLTQGNALTIPLADESVHCVVTSPPYWGLRDYGIGDQLGLEPTPEAYVANMVAVFREVKRVLRADGTVWLNLGDSYNSGSGGYNDKYKGEFVGREDIKDKVMSTNNYRDKNLKPKDLCGVPWRVAFALQADGWWLRSDIIWSKPNPMPESVTDRPTKAHEYLFLLTKSKTYYYDADAVREDNADPSRTNYAPGKEAYSKGNVHDASGRERRNDGFEAYKNGKTCEGRNRRTVWHIATAPYSGAHFATYPPALVEPCIKAGTSEHGVCPECGSPWERVVEKSDLQGPGHENYRLAKAQASKDDPKVKGRSDGWWPNHYKESLTLGWQLTCVHTKEWFDALAKHSGKPRRSSDPIPATVFDPFAGSGTTLQVAHALGRNGIGLDLSLEYLHLARQRLSLDAWDGWGKAKKDGKSVSDLPMFKDA